jgi:hypothetical protein
MIKHSYVSNCDLKISKDWQGGWLLFLAICINLGIYAHPLVALECDSVWWWVVNWFIRCIILECENVWRWAMTWPKRCVELECDSVRRWAMSWLKKWEEINIDI